MEQLGKSEHFKFVGRKIFHFEGIGMSGEVPGVVWKVWEAGIIYLLGVLLFLL